MGRVRRAGAGVGVPLLLLAVWAGLAAATSPPTPEIKTEAPPPKPEALFYPQECQLYVLGELQGIKKHGETWLNDGSACEMCTCFHGLVRCYYHYCNAGLTEGFMTPPSERPPLDDEDHDDLEEGSGRPPLSDDFYKVLHDLEQAGSQEAERESKKDQRENETHHPTSSNFCNPPCQKSCPRGFKVDEVQGCQRCKCHKCPSVRGCKLQCPGGLAQDHNGCRTCHCQNPKLAIITAAHDDDFIVDEVSGSGVYITAQTSPPYNATHTAGQGETDQDPQHDGQNTSRVHLDHVPITHSHNYAPASGDVSQHQSTSTGASDGMTKSAVQASPVEWSQLCLIIVPLVLVFLLVAALTLHYWRRYHRDKYDINAYRPTETEKLRPVKTADDHLHVRHV